MSDNPSPLKHAAPPVQDEAAALPAAGAQMGGKKGGAPSKAERLILGGTWLIALGLAAFAIYLGWTLRIKVAAPPPVAVELTQAVTQPQPEPVNNVEVDLPALAQAALVNAIPRRAMLHTIIPTRSRMEAIDYTVTTGDSIFGIAQKFSLKPESILWANYDKLNDNPDMLSPGMTLKIPPINGVFYQWQPGDQIATVAAKFEAKPEDILSFPGNRLDLSNPQIQANAWVMVPDGHREFKQWIVPVIPRGNAGVNKTVLGPGACEGDYTNGYNGGGSFIWPTASHYLSGNDYWSGHLGIDIAGAVGDGVFAVDSGVVVFSGWSTGGYGYMIMVDHGATGYQTLYAHLSAVSARCGANVGQGQYIGALGSTGNSTGPHLHFEVRYLGGFVNPWYVLPPP